MHHEHAETAAATCEQGKPALADGEFVGERRLITGTTAAASLNPSNGAAEGNTGRLTSAIRLAAKVLLVGVICHVSTEIGFAHKLPPHNISALWPTGAILLSVLVATPVRHWWAYTIAAYFTSVMKDASAGFPVAAFLFVIAGIIEIWLAAFAVRRFAGGLRAFENHRNLAAYIIIAVVLGPFISAFVAAFAGTTHDYWFYWRVWFLSEAVAFLTLAPAIITGIGITTTAVKRLSIRHFVEAGLIGLGLFAVCARVFNWPIDEGGTTPALVYLPLPFLLWAAMRFGPLGVNVSLLIVAIMSISGAVQERGPFAGTGSDDPVVSLQLFLIAMSIPLMFLAALISEGREKTSILSESEARFRSMADTAPVMIWMSDSTRRCNYVNRPWLDFAGRTIEQEQDDRWVAGIHPDDRDRCSREFETSFIACEQFAMEYRRRRRDGEYRWILDCGNPRRAADGSFVGYIGSCIDIEERKQAEEELRTSHEQQRDLASRLLRAQEVERRRLAREMHDDLTQRLAVMAIDIGKLEQRPDLSGIAVVSLRRTREQLVTLSEDVHDLSRQLHPSILDDLGLVDALRSECDRYSRQERIAVNYRAEDVPAGLPRDHALCLYLIAQEALRNVARHAHSERVEVTLTGNETDILLTVSDEGKGFDLTATRSHHGLGLISMEERARLIGAELSIESHPAKGTTVSVLLPQCGRKP